MTNNLRIWDNVKETNPANTEKVSYGAYKYTAIDAYSQILKATELWGPMGLDWGYTTNFFQLPGLDDMLFVELGLWYFDDDGQTKSEEIKVTTSGQVKYPDKNGVEKTDVDLPKKILTNALTKALSYLGFSADVFMGRFDDNSYVQEMREKHNPPADSPPADPPPIPPRRKLWDVAKTLYGDMPDDEVGAIVNGLAAVMEFDLKALSVEQADKMIDELLKDGKK